MSALERHVEWTSPATLWDRFNGRTSAAQRRVFRTPGLLRFASDTSWTTSWRSRRPIRGR